MNIGAHELQPVKLICLAMKKKKKTFKERNLYLHVSNHILILNCHKNKFKDRNKRHSFSHFKKIFKKKKPQ